jgi:hypothetical protein
MEANQQLQKVSDVPSLPVIALIHHPPDWWHEEETHAYKLRPNSAKSIQQEVG